MTANFANKIISHNFSRAAKEYSNNALIQKAVAKKLCYLIADKINQNSKILDLGCGTGFIKDNLQNSTAKIFECDLSFAMLKNPNKKYGLELKTQCDFANLPFKKNSFDFLVSSFSLQWLNNFSESFNSFYQILKKDGIFAVAIPTYESLSEIKSSKIFQFNDLPTKKLIEDSFINCGFKIIASKEEILSQSFDSGISAVKFIKNIGANNCDTKPQIITKKQFHEFENLCLKNSANKTKNFSLSWKILYVVSTKHSD